MIDNETFLNSFENGQPLVYEMEKLLFYSTRRFGKCDASFYDKTLCEKSIAANIYFLQQYIANYPLEYQPALRDYLLFTINIINEQGPLNKTSHPDAIAMWRQALRFLMPVPTPNYNQSAFTQ